MDQTEILNKKDQEIELLKSNATEGLELMKMEFDQKFSDMDAENTEKMVEYDMKKNSELERIADDFNRQKGLDMQHLEEKLREEFLAQTKSEKLAVHTLEEQLVSVTTEKHREVLELTNNFNVKMGELKNSDKSEILNEKLQQEMLKNSALGEKLEKLMSEMVDGKDLPNGDKLKEASAGDDKMIIEQLKISNEKLLEEIGRLQQRNYETNSMYSSCFLNDSMQSKGFAADTPERRSHRLNNKQG